jgi:hypothetical protein
MEILIIILKVVGAIALWASGLMIWAYARNQGRDDNYK